MKRLTFLALAALASFSIPLSAQLFDDDEMDDPFGGGGEKKKTAKKASVSTDFLGPANKMFKATKDNDSFGFDLKMNKIGELKILLEIAGEKYKKGIRVIPDHQELVYEQGKDKTAIVAPPESFKNHVLKFDIPNPSGKGNYLITYYVQPCFRRYTSVEANKGVAKWDETMPNALTCTMRIDFRPTAKGLVMFLNGAYGGLVSHHTALKSVKITSGSGTAPLLDNAKFYKNQQTTPDFEVVNFPLIANPGAMKDAVPSIKAGLRTVDGIPMYVADGAHSSDMSLVKGLRGMNFMAEVDYYMERTAWEHHPTTQQGAIPNGFYSEAYVLFALDPDPAKDRAFSFRIGRFADGGRIPGWSYTDVFLPLKDEDFPENIKKVGTVQWKGKEIPLYLGRFPIDAGITLDIVTHDVKNGRRHDYLDYDFLGRRKLPGAYGDPSHRPDESMPSAVNIFGVTFRKAGIFVDLIQKEPGNIFFNDEVPETTVVVTAERAGNYGVNWRIMDTTGKTVLKSGSEKMDFSKAGEEKRFTIDLAQPDIGHYLLFFDVLVDGKKIFTHDASFALLGKDTRLATPAESPFGSWWTPAHYGVSDPEVFMKIFNKVGIRRPCGVDRFVDENGNFPPDIKEKIQKYKLTLNQFSWCKPPPKEDDPAEFDKFMHSTYDPLIKAFPDTKYALVFHESFGDSAVPESHGEKGESTEKDQKFAKVATDVAEWFRANHPEIKLCYGNNTSSSALIAALLRNGFKTEYLDFIGIETPGQGCIPERIWQGGTQGMWIAREVGKTWGKDLKVTGCFEFSARPDRLFSCPQEQAAYYMRDALIGLGNGFETIGLSGLSNAGGWYTQTLWGTGSLCTKAPLIYPKPMLCAYAAMTRALDRIKFNPVSRDTGNLSCYALEFERKGGDIAYAFWVPKGESEMVFEFPESVDGEHIEFLGKTTKISGKTIKMTATIYPQYLIVPKKAADVKHIKTITPQPGENYKPVVKFESVDDIFVFPGAGSLSIPELDLRTGKFNVREVNDEEKGKCLEFELVKEGTIPDISPEYTRFELKKPVTLYGTPDEVGLWVKGDGGWGKIGFDIQDARGYRYRNEGNWVDFAADTYLNFKGWYFMTYQLQGKNIKPRHPQSLGSPWAWEVPHIGMPVYPVKLIGMHITLRRKMLAPCQMREAQGVVRIKEFGGIINPEFQPDPKFVKMEVSEQKTADTAVPEIKKNDKDGKNEKNRESENNETAEGVPLL